MSRKTIAKKMHFSYFKTLHLTKAFLSLCDYMWNIIIMVSLLLVSAFRSQYERGILLIRNPAEAMLAEFNRRKGGHMGMADPDRVDPQGKLFLQGIQELQSR